MDELLKIYPIGERILSEKAQKKFIWLWGAILKLRNILSAFDRFQQDSLLTERDVQDYCSIYNTLHEKWRSEEHEKEDINDDVEFEMELISNIEVNIDYILNLVSKYHDAHTSDRQVEIKNDIERAIGASPKMRSKKDLIEDFIASLTPQSNVGLDWNAFVHERIRTELDNLINDEKLKPEPAKRFVNDCFHEGYVETSGTAVAGILPPMPRFQKGGNRDQKKQDVIDRLRGFFNRFYDICPEGIDEGGIQEMRAPSAKPV